MPSARMLFVIYLLYVDVTAAFRNTAGDKNEVSELEAAHAESPLPDLREAVVSPDGAQDGFGRIGALLDKSAASVTGDSLSVPLPLDSAPPASEEGEDGEEAQVQAIRPTPAGAKALPAVDISVLEIFARDSTHWARDFGGLSEMQHSSRHVVAALGVLVAIVGCLVCLCSPANLAERRGSEVCQPRASNRGRARTRESLFDDVLSEVTRQPSNSGSAAAAGEQEGGSFFCAEGGGAREARTEAGPLLAEIQALAPDLRTTAGKYPKSGRGVMFSGRRVQQRFLAVTQANPSPSSKRTGSSAEAELRLWRRGLFAWWESEAAFAKRMDPKGQISLHKIIDVLASKTPRTVVVSHRDGDHQCWLELLFESEAAAAKWSNTFRELLEKLNSSDF